MRELMNTYDVHIMLSPAEEKLDYIKVIRFALTTRLETYARLYFTSPSLFRSLERRRVFKARRKLSLRNARH